MQQIADLAGVSKKTVSRVLNGEPFVREDTRARIQALIDEMGFTPDPQARSLALRQGHLIGLVYDNPNPQYVVNMQLGLLEGMKGSGMELVVHPCRWDDPDVIANLRRFVTSLRPFGLIVTPAISEDERIAAALREAGCPFVRIASVALDEPECMLVTRDRLGGREAGRHIAGLGHVRCAFVSGPPRFRSSAERRAGFEEGLAEAGLELAPQFAYEGAYTFESGLAAGLDLLSRADRPTAVFAANDDMAAGVLQAAHRLGLRVPQELTVVGYDDFDVASQVLPGLTTVRAPTREVGAIAVRRLLGRPDPAPRDLTPELVVRASSGRVPAGQGALEDCR